MTEKTLQSHIIKALGSRDDVRIFRNNVGVGFVGHIEHHDRARQIITLSKAHQINFGLFPGSPDLIGWKSVTLNEMRLAVIIGIEVKQPDGRTGKHQENFIRVMREMGAIAGVARSVEEAEEIINNMPGLSLSIDPGPSAGAVQSAGRALPIWDNPK